MSLILDSFASRDVLIVGAWRYPYRRLTALEGVDGVRLQRLPLGIKILLEMLLRTEDGTTVTRDHILSLARWGASSQPGGELALRPSRVLLQDYTGLPALVDLAAMRDAAEERGADPRLIDPLVPVDLVIDHAVEVYDSGSAGALQSNAEREFARHRQRFVALKWAQHAFGKLRVVPPDSGIVHQIHLERLAQVVTPDAGGTLGCDIVLGADSHTTMVNALGMLGWGAGGIEIEAAMLGEPVGMTVPGVVGVRLSGALRPGVTSTDLVLTVAQRLRRHGVVGKFVEFFGPGLSALSLADRATVANMAPEYGSTVALFPIDAQTLDYLRLTGRTPEHVALVEAFVREQGLQRDDAVEADYSERLELDLGTVEPVLAGPDRPHQRVALGEVATGFATALKGWKPNGGARPKPAVADGTLAIAAITSCTNTSNPSVMIAAGLLAKAAVERGLRPPSWVKTSLAPGSRVVGDYLARSGLQRYLGELGFAVAAYGCTTCIGNSGPLAPELARAVREDGAIVAAVLSGNRNFTGRIHPLVRANYLASPPLVVAYALAGRIDVDLTSQPLGVDRAGAPVFLRELWPANAAIDQTVAGAVSRSAYEASYAELFAGDARWQALSAPSAPCFAWDPHDHYVRRPPFSDFDARADHVGGLRGARVLARFGDGVTTDHIVHAMPIEPGSVAGRYLLEQGVAREDLHSFGARRANHELTVRGTFTHPWLRNELAPDAGGGMTVHLPSNELLPIYEAAQRYRAEGTPLIVVAGANYGTGSSRDGAAKGPLLLGVRAIIARSFERIHRSNLVCMGVLPLQFREGESLETFGLDGREIYEIDPIPLPVAQQTVAVHATTSDGRRVSFEALVRVETAVESEYLRHGGVLPYVLARKLAANT